MAIRLYDSLTRELRELEPGSADGVFRFYNCGPTVYAPAHIGNFRTFLVNDVIRRLLELEFGAEKVRHVRNLTDVDDKTIRRANRRAILACGAGHSCLRNKKAAPYRGQ
jgi:cysteinyl-tRNA synthetase